MYLNTDANAFKISESFLKRMKKMSLLRNVFVVKNLK